MRVLVALGGNALLRRGEPPEASAQQRNVDRAAAAVALLAQEHELVVTHGNGPQVGLLALQAQAYREVAPYPLDVLGAQTEGMIGYLLEQALGAHLPGKAVATLLTQVVVDPDDPAFTHPSKPIGPLLTEREARELAASASVAVAPDGAGFRRVVASPEPIDVVELSTIRLLVDAGVLVVCAGGGGIPVVRVGESAVRGVEAVVDKDLAAALLARHLHADALLLLTDVPAVMAGHGTASQTPIRTATVAELQAMDLAPGSMGPKVEAACRFAEAGGLAVIGALGDAAAALRGEAGTLVTAT